MKTNTLTFYGSLLTPSVFFLTALFLGAITKDYNSSKETISMLVHSSNGVWQIANFVVCGILMIVLGMQTLRLKSRKKFKNKVGNVIRLFGLIMIALAITPTDMTLFPTTPLGVIHVLLFVVAVSSFLFYVFKVGLATKRSNPRYSYYSMGSLLTVLVSSLLMVTVQEYAGVFQKIVVLSFIVWFTVSPLVVKKARISKVSSRKKLPSRKKQPVYVAATMKKSV